MTVKNDPCPNCGQIHSPEADRKTAERCISLLAVAAAISAAKECAEILEGLNVEMDLNAPTGNVGRIAVRAVEHFCLEHGESIARVLAMLGTAKVAELALAGRDPAEWMGEQLKLLRSDAPVSADILRSNETKPHLN